MSTDNVDGLLQRIAAQSHFEERYELRGHLARGGMGEVLRAFDRVLLREVAVKRTRSDSAGLLPGVRGQFLKEARVGGRLLHPNILPVFDLGVDHEGRIYFTMRIVSGQTLQEFVDEWQGEDGLGILVEAFRGVCRGIEFAHQNGVLHLDLKPHNVLVSTFREVFVIDWGLARVDDEDDTDRLADLYRDVELDPEADAHTAAFGRIVGTPGYMAGEQADGNVRAFGPGTDVYGLGGVLHYLLYGTAPNRGLGFVDILMASRQAKTRGVLRSSLQRVEWREVVGRLEAVCLRCLEADAARRYPDVGALLAELG